MKSLIISLLLVLVLNVSVDAENINAVIKQKLKIELTELRKDISEADKTVDKLRDDRVNIEVGLKNMEIWGVGQQEEKDKYYSETVVTRQQAAEQAAAFTAKIDKLKAKIDTDFKKYRRLKSLACYFVAVAFVLLYLRFGASLVSALAVASGPWTPLLTFGGPVGAFGVGYMIVYLLF